MRLYKNPDPYKKARDLHTMYDREVLAERRKSRHQQKVELRDSDFLDRRAKVDFSRAPPADEDVDDEVDTKPAGRREVSGMFWALIGGSPI